VTRPFDRLRDDLFTAVASVAAPVVLVEIPGDHPVADLIRALERAQFPDVEAFLTDEVESRCRFLAVVDRSGPEPALAFATRVSSPRFGPTPPRPDETGLPMLDEVLAVNEGIDAPALVAHYGQRGVDVARCVAVETNFRLAPTRDAPTGLRWSDHAYVGVFDLLMEGPPGGKGVFAHANEATVRSLGAIDLTFEAVMGRPDLVSPAAQQGEADDRYAPGYIDLTEHSRRVFRQLEPLSAPKVVLA